MDKVLRYELTEQLNVIKRLLRESVQDGDVTQRERETIMKHVGAMKAVLKDDFDVPGMSRHVMRDSRSRS